MNGVNTEENSVHSKTYKITFSSGYVIEKCSIYRLAKDNGYSPHHIYSMAAGKRKKHKDIISVEKIENLKKLLTFYCL